MDNTLTYFIWKYFGLMMSLLWVRNVCKGAAIYCKLISKDFFGLCGPYFVYLYQLKGKQHHWPTLPCFILSFRLHDKQTYPRSWLLNCCSPFTAWGTFLCMFMDLRFLFGSKSATIFPTAFQ